MAVTNSGVSAGLGGSGATTNLASGTAKSTGAHASYNDREHACRQRQAKHIAELMRLRLSPTERRLGSYYRLMLPEALQSIDRRAYGRIL